MEVKEVAKSEVPVMLAEYMELVIHQLREEKKYAAVHTYRSTLNSFTAFAVEKGADLSVGTVFTPGRLIAYETWLRQRGVKWNTVSTYMRTLKAVYNRLYEPGMLGHNPKLFDGVYTKVDSLTKRAVTEEQMGILLATDFEALPEELRSVLAYFLLMFYFRGMPHIDFAYLHKQDVDGDKIGYCRHKTGRRITVRIPREAAALFETYRDKTPASPYLFPVFEGKLPQDDGELYNYYQRALRRFNKKLAKVAALLLPGTKLSSYTARHTWATLARYRGINPSIISQALGHSSIKVTETYFKPFADEKVDRANDELIGRVIKGRNKREIGLRYAPLNVF